MEQLFTPHVGLMVWTVAAFLVLVGVLGKFAWGPILQALDARAEGIKNTIRSADESKRAAEELRKTYEDRLAQVESRTRALLAEAEIRARGIKEELVRAAHEENEKLLEATRKKMHEEERRLVRDLRTEMAAFSLQAAEKMLRRGLDKPFQDRLLQEALSDFEKWAGEK